MSQRASLSFGSWDAYSGFMGAQKPSDPDFGEFKATFKREVDYIVAQRRAFDASSQPSPSTDEGDPDVMTASAQIRTRDLGQALDLLDGLERIMASFHQEQRGRHEPDPIVQELEAITSHGYNWEALRYQEGVGEGWFYMAASIEVLRTRLLEAYTNATY